MIQNKARKNDYVVWARAWKLCKSKFPNERFRDCMPLKMWTIFFSIRNKCRDNFPLDSSSRFRLCASRTVFECVCVYVFVWGLWLHVNLTSVQKDLLWVDCKPLFIFYHDYILSGFESVCYNIVWCERSEMRTIVVMFSLFFRRFCQSGCGFSSLMPSSKWDCA